MDDCKLAFNDEFITSNGEIGEVVVWNSCPQFGTKGIEE